MLFSVQWEVSTSASNDWKMENTEWKQHGQLQMHWTYLLMTKTKGHFCTALSVACLLYFICCSAPFHPRSREVFSKVSTAIFLFSLCYSHGLVSANYNSTVTAIMKGNNCSLSLLSPVFLALHCRHYFTFREAIHAFRELNGQAMCSTCCSRENTQGGI